MPSTSEAAIIALVAVLDGLALVRRNEGLPSKIPSGGLIVVHDGNPGEPETTLSPLTYHFEHSIDLDVFVQESGQDDVFDALKVAIGTAILANRTLSGTVDWAEPMAPRAGNLPIEAAAPIRAATISVVLHYATTNPLN